MDLISFHSGVRRVEWIKHLKIRKQAITGKKSAGFSMQSAIAVHQLYFFFRFPKSISQLIGQQVLYSYYNRNIFIRDLEVKGLFLIWFLFSVDLTVLWTSVRMLEVSFISTAMKRSLLVRGEVEGRAVSPYHRRFFKAVKTTLYIVVCGLKWQIHVIIDLLSLKVVHWQGTLM